MYGDVIITSGLGNPLFFNETGRTMEKKLNILVNEILDGIRVIEF